MVNQLSIQTAVHISLAKCGWRAVVVNQAHGANKAACCEAVDWRLLFSKKAQLFSHSVEVVILHLVEILTSDCIFTLWLLPFHFPISAESRHPPFSVIYSNNEARVEIPPKNNLALSSYGDPMQAVASCSYLTGVGPGVVLCCCSLSVSGSRGVILSSFRFGFLSV